MKKTLLLFLITLSACLMAQRVKVISGDYNFLKDQKFVKVVFKFEGVTFAKKKISEQQYIADRMEDIEKASGKEEAENGKQIGNIQKIKLFRINFWHLGIKTQKLKPLQNLIKQNTP